MSLINILFIAVIIFQFTPQGQQFFSTDKGAAAMVGLATVAIILMLPSILALNVMSILFAGIWVYLTYPRLNAAKRYFKSLLPSK